MTSVWNRLCKIVIWIYTISFVSNHLEPFSDRIYQIRFISNSSSRCGNTVKLKQFRVDGDHTQLPQSPYPGKVELEVTSDRVNFTAILKRHPNFKSTISVHFLTLNVVKSSKVNQDKTQPNAAIYSDDDSAIFYIQSVGNVPGIVQGYFHHNSSAYTVNCEESGTCYIVEKFIHSRAEQRINFQKKNVLETLPFEPHNKRKKRQVQLYEVEICLALDYSLYKRWMAETNMADNDTLSHKMTSYYRLIFHGVNSRFRSIKGSDYVINILLSNIVIAQDPAISPWTHLYSRQSPSGPMVSEKSLKALTDWLAMPAQAWLQCDHVMALTAKNLAHDGSMKTLGLSYLQSMCTEKSVSIIEDHGNMAYISYIAAHELAHSLGARHDGVTDKVRFGDRVATCREDDGFIMRPKASSNPDTIPGSPRHRWIFSPCTGLYFEFYLSHLDHGQNNCLLDRVAGNDDHASSDMDEESNLLQDLDYYCETIVGDRAVLVRGILEANFSDICRSVPCSGLNKHGIVPTLPAEGLKCGAAKSCRSGKCSSDGDIKIKEQKNLLTCPYGDEPGNILSTGKTCSQLVSSDQFAYKCYDLQHECCETCFQFRRHFTSLPDCHYGDKMNNCDSNDCNSNRSADCCETCAKRSNIIKECKNLASPKNGGVTINTGTFYEGSVATFKCNHGYSVHGNTTSVCLATGHWTSYSPRCVLGCPHLSIRPFINYKLNGGNRSVGTEVRFTCPRGLTMKGDHVIRCQNDSTWSGTPPVCRLAFSSKNIAVVSENSDPTTFKHELVTLDADASFALIGYSHPRFNLSIEGYVTAVANMTFNYETTKEYRLVVMATSSIHQSLTSTQTLRIKVLDVNDAPVFTRTRYKAHVWMPISKGTTVLQVTATDEDNNQLLTYSAMRTSAPFRIDPDNGKIISLRDIDVVTKSSYSLIVYAMDSGKPQKTATAELDICVGVDMCETGTQSGCYRSILDLLLLVFCFLFNIIPFNALNKIV